MDRNFTILDEPALRAAKVSADPYPHLRVEKAIAMARRASLLGDMPRVAGIGSHRVERLTYGKNFADLLRDLQSPALRGLIEDRFGIDLSGCDGVTTVRGWCGARDGNVHTDIARKAVTLLLYLNEEWRSPGGCLRLLRSPDLTDYAIEIAPVFGSLLIFPRSDRSWHGHTRYDGRRVSVQHNWMKPRIETFLGNLFGRD